MKKLLVVFLAITIVLSALTLTSCGDEKLKFGVGMDNTVGTVKNADGDTDGSAEVISNIAAVLVDSNGKIVKCVIDTADNTVNYTSDGKAVAKSEFKTKYELGFDYNMVKYSEATKEWFEQVDALNKLVEGKTITEVKALVAEGGKGTDEVINAGCTIMIDGFIKAIEAAVNAAEPSDATKNDTLKIGVFTTMEGTDATADKAGECEVVSTIVASAVNGDKVVATFADALQVKFSFDTNGASTFDATKALKTKRELGTDYGMSTYGANSDRNGDGVVKEWNEQADAFEANCIGKTSSEIAGLEAAEGYGSDELQVAGCTITVTELVKAAVKSATIG